MGWRCGRGWGVSGHEGAKGRRTLGVERACRGWVTGEDAGFGLGGRLHPLDHPLPPPVQCFSFNGHDKAEIVKWPEAKQACESQGAVLATIASPLEQGMSPPPTPTPSAWDPPGLVTSAPRASLAAFITSMLPNISFDLWIGLHDAQREFRWVEGEPLRHTSWAPSEPSGCGAPGPRDKPVSETHL